MSDELTRFTKAVEHWCVKFGLHDWAVMVHTDALGNPGPQAQVHLSWDAKYADVVWNTDNPADLPASMSPERLALHEVLHILICDIRHVPRDGKSLRGKGAIDSAQHAFINRIMRVLMPVSDRFLDNEDGK